jgi:NAD(P)-dependent dehydrogenase (short-subunit alcohol dehydrogenase family)
MGMLDNKAVVITGAGRGLGRAYALQAAGCGAAVVVNDVDADVADEVVERIRGDGGRAVASHGSVVDPDYARDLVEHCVTEFGAVDGLVNNAGLRHQALLWEEDPDRARALIEVNVLGSMNCGIFAAKRMVAQGAGSIVNAGSLALVGQSTAATYSASKGAIASMTFAWAGELAEHGVRVNAVCPVAWTRLAEADTKPTGNPEDTPDLMAPLVTYLLSDLAAGVTGQLIRFRRGTLYVVRQPAVKQPVLQRDHWEVEDIARAFDSELADALEPRSAERGLI